MENFEKIHFSIEISVKFEFDAQKHGNKHFPKFELFVFFRNKFEINQFWFRLLAIISHGVFYVPLRFDVAI